MSVEELQQAAVELEDAERTWTPEDERAFVAELPTEVQESIEHILAEADTEALKDALLAILVVLLLALLGSVFMARQSGSEQEIVR